MCDVCPPLERHERQQETDGQRGVSSVLLKACKGCGRLMSLDELGEVDVIEFLTASKGIHFIMQDIVSDALLNIVETEPIERETSAFDEYDRENGYEDEEQEEQNTWKICGEIVDRVTKIAIRLMRESYGQCMKENIIELLKYLKFELETVNENT